MSELPSGMGSFSMGEACFLTHISRDTLRVHCDRGVIRHYRTGGLCGHRRITREALMVFMRSYDIPLDLATRGACPQPQGCAPSDFKMP